MLQTSVSLLERLARSADQAAWDRFAELYTPLLFHWARQAGLQESDAADLVQDVFVLLLRKLPEFRYDRQRSFRSWLRAVTLNKWRERRRQSHTPLVSLVEGDDVLEEDPAEQYWEVEYHRHLAGRALALMQAEFQPATWQAAWQTAVEGRSAADVAAELGLTVGAVYAAKCRVLARLRQELEGMLA